jgi:iron(II)-dependent oxidoreductase
MPQDEKKHRIKESMTQARETTLRLMERVPEPFLKVRVHDFYSPIGWHFGHIGMTEEYWVNVHTMGQSPRNEHLSFLFANLPDNPKDNRVHLPDRNEIIDYLTATRQRALEALEQADLNSDDFFRKDGYVWEFALQHEYQHQETIMELLQLIYRQQGKPARLEAFEWHSDHRMEMTSLPSGEFTMGSDEPHVYDNEREPHRVYVEPFRLARTPVTAYEWTLFMQADGYDRREFWSEAGWDWRERESVTMPEYWIIHPDRGGYFYYGAFGIRPLQPDEPVSSISWYEADAYARWAGKRLPTEVEWEYAARFDPTTGGSRRYPWGDTLPTPEQACFGMLESQPSSVFSRLRGASAFGILGLAGGVWEWTSTLFLPYPGFRAYPYDGYSKEHMDGKHKVCRGGSWATSAPILRASFRNWYVPTYRQGFLGMRPAE